MKNTLRIYLLCFLLFYSFACAGLFAQHINYREHRIEQYDISKGMSSNNVLSIAQDGYGFLWVGTSQGVNIFDGKNFTVYDKDDDVNASNISLSNNYAQFLTVSNDGNIWIATSHGLNIYNYEADSMEVIKHTDSPNSISSSDIICFSNTKNGIWVATYDKGIDYYDYAKRTFSKLKLPDYFDGFYITYILADRNDNLWIGTLYDGLYCYSIRTGGIIPFKIPRVQKIIQDSYGTIWVAATNLYTFNHHTQTLEKVLIDGIDNSMYVNCIEEDDTGFLWIGYNECLGYFNLRDYYFYRTTRFMEVKQTGQNWNMPFRTVTSIKMDKDNNIWIGTYDDGLYMIHNNKDKFIHVVHNGLDDNSLSTNKIRSVSEDGQGGFFVGTDGFGIDVLNRNFERERNISVDVANLNGSHNNYVLSVLYDSEGNLWCGGNGLSLMKKGSNRFIHYMHDSRQPDTGILSDKIRVLSEGADGSVWIGSDYGLTRYKNGKFSNDFIRAIGRKIDVRSIVADGDYLWLGTYGSGIISYHVPTNSVVVYHNNDNLPQNYIYALKQRGDTLCVATIGSGIHLFSIHDKVFFDSYGKHNGLKSDYIQAVEIDKYGRIWAASNEGISCVAKNKIRHYDQKDGIQKNDFFYSLRTVDRNGAERLIFCGNDGINFFNPDDLPLYPKSNQVLFNSLKIYNQPVRPSKEDKNNPLSENLIMTRKIVLSHTQSFFSVGFINIDFNYANNMQYSYMLKGSDIQWNDIGQQQEISFRQLPAGKYTLMVKTTNFDDEWNDNVSELEIIIKPPFWKTPLAYFIYSILFVLLLYGIWVLLTIKMQAQHRINLEKSERQKDEEIHQAKLRFFTNISHELRTPLTLIIGPLETLRQKYPALARETSVISQNAQKLLLLVNQLLDFRKTEMKEMKLKVTYANLTQQVHHIVNSFDGLTQEKNMNLSLVSSPLNLNGWYDPNFIDKIMHNLLSNAYKFTPENGEINIEIIGVMKEERLWACIKVTDTGCGIAKNEQELIFDRFYQSDHMGLSQRGSGIGLNLVKNLVDLHHGTIVVNSVLKEGTSFVIEIPIDKACYGEQEIIQPLKESGLEEPVPDNLAEMEGLAEPADRTENSMEDITILVVDDEIGICQYIKQILPETYHVLFAANGKEALSILSQEDCDVVISDVMMPEMDGITLCDTIKKNIETSHIPVILLTAKSSIESRIEGLKTGADSYISKPFHPEHLLIRVEKLIESRKLFKSKFSKTFSFDLAHNEEPSFDDLLLQKVLNYINTNISNPELNGDKVAKELSISRMTLHRKLKLLTGQTISELIRGIRLKEAAYQIENSSKNISDICYEVGFNSPSYFTACFTSQYGMTPTEYLKKKRGGAK